MLMRNPSAARTFLTRLAFWRSTSASDVHGAERELPPKPANTRFELLDVFRGVACLMLVLYHATFYAEYSFHLTQPSTWSWVGLPLYVVSQSWVGVPMFFVISGYCIAASIDSLRRRPQPFRGYFVRRFRRIYPPLWAMGGVAIVVTTVVRSFPTVAEGCAQLPHLDQFTIWNWLGNFTATEGWMHHVVAGQKRYLMLTIWTLCYEEQFYLVTGVLLALVPRQLFCWSAIVTLCVVVARHVARAQGISTEGFFWDGHWLIFSGGLLVYQAVNYYSLAARRTALTVLGLGTIYGVIDRFAATGLFQEDLSKHVCVGCVFAGLLIVLHRWDRPLANHWALLPLRYCGQRSYSIYLTHYLFVVVVASWMAQHGFRTDWSVALVTVPVCFVITLPIAWVFFNVVERRCLNEPLPSANGRRLVG